MESTHCKMRSFSLPCLLLLSLSLSALLIAREKLTLVENWQFSLCERGRTQSPAADSEIWSPVALPHDWSWEAGPRKDGAQGGEGGYRIGGLGWYRNDFELPENFADKRVLIHFEGAFRNATVSLNGHQFETHPYGFLSFSHDLTDHLKAGRNELTVQLDCRQEPASRWYHPCGLFAPVWLEGTARESYLIPDGIVITTPEASPTAAVVEVVAEIENPEGLEVEVQLLDAENRLLAKETAPASARHTASFTLAEPARWSIESPVLHSARVSLRKAEQVVDEKRVSFGIRTIRWDAAEGFFLNEESVKLRGVCEHLAGGPVGGAWPRELLEWKLRELQAMGCNAIRTAHNPQTPAFYELCDQLGILVMDEIFDGWSKKAAKDYGALHFEKWWRRDLTTWVRRNRNHPCIVIYSVGNETHGKIAPQLVEVVRQHDATRPVTSGDSERQEMDVHGINGASEKQSFFRTGPFEKAFVATEAPHTWQVRGFYQSLTWYRDGYPNERQQPFEVPDLTAQEVFPNAALSSDEMANRKQIFLSSYDNATVRVNARQHWQQVRDLPWIAGNFRWTGFDYPGEATYVHGGWPFHAFAGGTHDLAGFPKDLAFFYRSQWTVEPMVHLLPHWTHPLIAAGTVLPVQAYSNAEEVELFLNGRSLGIDRPGRHWDEMQCQWMVPWQAGTLLAIARTEGKEVARHQFTTASHPTDLLVATDLSYSQHPIITIESVDQNKTPYPYGENPIYAHLSGDARLLAFENGHPADPTRPVAGERRAFMGKARLFLHSPGNNYQLTLASIVGERRQLTSSEVSMVVQCFEGATAIASDQLTLCYTLDGTEPTLESAHYSAPFSVPADCTVRATVFRDRIPLLQMSETFGPRLGLHWSDLTTTRKVGSATALQAETAKYRGARISRVGAGYHGQGYLDFRGKEGSLHFYQENDGPPGAAKLVIRYAHADPKSLRPLDVFVNNQKIANAKFKASGSWNTDWRELTLPVNIQSGANQIRLETRGQSGPNIDEIDLR